MEDTRSIEEVKAWFAANGLTIREWARTYGYPPEQVYAVLSGRARGKHGKAHDIAVKLKLKAEPPAQDAWVRRARNRCGLGRGKSE